MITITSVLFEDEYTGIDLSTVYPHDSGSTAFMGSVGDKMLAKISGYIAAGSKAIPVQFSAVNNTIIRTDAGSFLSDGIQIGDTIAVTGSANNNTTYTVSTLTAQVITTVGAIAHTSTDKSVNIYVSTPVESIDIYYNVSNQQGLVSLTDTVTQKLSSDNNYPFTSFIGTCRLYPTTKSTAWYDDAQSTINIVAINGTYQRLFTANVIFYIKPFYLAGQQDQLTDVLNNTTINSPDYFKDLNCLSFNYQVDAKYKRVSGVVNHTSGQQTIAGNTGWFNEYLNENEVYDSPYYDTPGADWKFISLVYKDHVNGNVIPTPDYTRTTDVTITLKNTGVDTSAGANAFAGCPFVLNFMWLPVSPSAYQNNRTVVTEPGAPFPLINPSEQLFNHRVAFLHDRAFQVEAVGAVNGDRFGSDYQALTNVVAAKTGIDECVFTFTLNLGAAIKNTFASNNKDFAIWITPQSSATAASNIRAVKTLETTDRNAVLCDVNTMIVNTDDASQLSLGNSSAVLFYQYPAGGTPYTNFAGVVGQYGYAVCDFSIPSTSVLLLVKVAVNVNVYNGANLSSVFPLEVWQNDVSAMNNNIEIYQTRNFDLPSGSLYNERSITSLPTPNNFEIIYGFQLGYQFWQNVAQFDPAFNAMHTQYWAEYTQNAVQLSNGLSSGRITPAGFTAQLTMDFTFQVEDVNGVITQFTQTCYLYAYDGLNTVSQGSGSGVTQDTYGNDLHGGFAGDTQTTGIVVFDVTLNPVEVAMLPDIIGTLQLAYTDCNGNYLDTITTQDSAPAAGSLWTAVPTIVVTGTNPYTITIEGVLDLTNPPCAISSIFLMGSYNYFNDGNLVTDDQQNIINDAGVNISIDQ